MAYRALTNIKYSDPKDSGAEVVLIEQGQFVTGLPTGAMKELWDAGALEKVDEPAPAPSTEETQE